MERLARNENLDKIVEAVERMNSLLLEKNGHIKMLRKYVKQLMNENAALNSESFYFEQTIKEITQQLKELRSREEELNKELKRLRGSTDVSSSCKGGNSTMLSCNKNELHSIEEKVSSLINGVKIKDMKGRKMKAALMFGVIGESKTPDTLFLSDALNFENIK